jgi:hypothetical protein
LEAYLPGGALIPSGNRFGVTGIFRNEREDDNEENAGHKRAA